MKNLIKASLLVAGVSIIITLQSYRNGEAVKTASFNSQFELKLDEKVFLPKAKKELTVSLVNINDNRCPENVQCITAGKAVAEIKLTSKDGSQAITELVLDQKTSTGDTTMVSLNETNYLIILSEVDRLYAYKAKVTIKKRAI